MVTAIIMKAPGAQVSGEDVDAYCRKRLAGFERPRAIRFVDALPRTSFGKVRKD